MYFRTLSQCNSSCWLASSPCTFFLNVHRVFAFSNSTQNLVCVDFTIFLFSKLVRLLVTLSHSTLVCLSLGASIHFIRI